MCRDHPRGKMKFLPLVDRSTLGPKKLYICPRFAPALFQYLTADNGVRSLVLQVAVLRTLAARGRTVEARHALGEARAVEAGAGVTVTWNKKGDFNRDCRI